jgi:fatty acyl-CoA reductase
VRKELVETCNVVINCAASIDFNARLDQSIDSNIRGTLRMMELAASLKHLEVFTHVSTCYVNADMSGLVKEEIFDREEDPEE